LDPTKSSTIQIGNQAVNLYYGSGNASGTIAQDTVSMGGFTVNPQVFGANSPFFIDFWPFNVCALCSAKSWWRRNIMIAKPLPVANTSALISGALWSLSIFFLQCRSCAWFC
jgi:Eukaryotic aspartyl protease